MTSSEGVEYCPHRSNLDWSNVQVSDFTQVQYTTLENSDEENIEDQGICTVSHDIAEHGN